MQPGPRVLSPGWRGSSQGFPPQGLPRPPAGWSGLVGRLRHWGTQTSALELKRTLPSGQKQPSASPRLGGLWPLGGRKGSLGAVIPGSGPREGPEGQQARWSAGSGQLPRAAPRLGGWGLGWGRAPRRWWAGFLDPLWISLGKPGRPEGPPSHHSAALTLAHRSQAALGHMDCIPWRVGR